MSVSGEGFTFHFDLFVPLEKAWQPNFSVAVYLSEFFVQEARSQSQSLFHLFT